MNFTFPLILVISTLLAVPSSAEVAPLKWLETSDYCSETDYCCFKGEALPKRECVRQETYEVPTPDASGMGEVRLIMKMYKTQGRLDSEWGMADALGNTLVKPDDGRVIPLSTRVLLRCEKTCRVESPDAKPREVGAVTDIPLLDGPPLHAIATKDEQGRPGLAVLRPDGTPGPVLTGAYRPQAMGTAAILRIFLEGNKGSVIVDALGNVLWTGPEIQIYGVINKRVSNGGEDNGTKLYAALIPTGTSPLPPGIDDGKLYQPLDQSGRPMKLPEGVLGVSPAYISAPGILDPKLSDGSRPDNAGAWLIVERKGKGGFRYRVGGGMDVAPEHVLRDYAKLPVLDEVTRVARRSGDKILAGHRVKENDWVVNPTVIPGYGATQEAALEDMELREQAARASAAAERDRLQAEIDRKSSLARAERESKAAELRARNLEHAKQFIPEFGRKCVHDGGFHCRYVEEAAFLLGEPHLSEFLSHQSGGWYSPAGSEENACAHGPSACAHGARLAGDTRRWVEAERKKQEDIKQFWQDVKNYKVPQADVKVNYYEGGRLKQKTMSASEYRGVYGP